MNQSSIVSRVKATEFRIDRICRRFERYWRLGRPVSIEECLSDVHVNDIPRLLEELIASEWELRVRNQQQPTMAEYLARFREHRELVEVICRGMALEYSQGMPPPRTFVPREGQHLGDYRILREIGRGGMGIVFEALQESLDRKVALKVLPHRRFRSERELLRFSREAKSVARLHHSNIVEVFGVGEHEGVHYFAMRYVHGRSLDQVISRCRVQRGIPDTDSNSSRSVLSEPIAGARDSHTSQTGSSIFLSRLLLQSVDNIESIDPMSRFRAAARIGRQIANALQYAHERGVLHRDIKPSNLILDRQDVCWLSDFGLAKVHLDSEEITESHDLIGTMRYMSPEVLTGKIDERSDLYSLGLTLYELLTLQPALDAVERGPLLAQVRDPRPVSPRRICPDLPRDLETIVLKAIAANPAHRYACAKDLEEDLDRFLRREPIHARPQGPCTKFMRWVQREPLLAFLALGTVSITVTSALSFFTLFQNTRQALLQMQADKTRTTPSTLSAASDVAESAHEQHLSHSLTKRDELLFDAGGSQTRRLLRQKKHFDALPSVVESLQSLQRLEDQEGAGRKSSEGASTVSFRSDLLKRLALETRLQTSATLKSAPRPLFQTRIGLEIKGGKSSQTFDLDPARPLTSDFRVRFDESDRTVSAYCVEQGYFGRWKWSTGESNTPSKSGAYGFEMITQSGQGAIQWSAGQFPVYRNLKNGQTQILKGAEKFRTDACPLVAWEGMKGNEVYVAFSAIREGGNLDKGDSKSESIQIGRWDAGTGDVKNAFLIPVSKGPVHITRLEQADILMIKTRSMVQLVGLPEGRILFEIPVMQSSSVTCSPEGGRMAIVTQASVAIFDTTDSHSPGSHVPRHQLSVQDVGEVFFAPSGIQIAVISQKFHFVLFNLQGGSIEYADAVHFPAEIQRVRFSSDGLQYAVVMSDGGVELRSAGTNRLVSVLPKSSPNAISAKTVATEWDSTGALFGVLREDQTMTVWDLRPLTVGTVLCPPAKGQIKAVVFDPDGTHVQMFCRDQRWISYDLSASVSTSNGSLEQAGAASEADFKIQGPAKVGEAGSRDDHECPLHHLLAVKSGERKLKISHTEETAENVVANLELEMPIQHFAFDLSSGNLFVSSVNTLHIWDRKSHRLSPPIPFAGPLTRNNAVIDRTERYVAIAEHPRQVSVWDTSDLSNCMGSLSLSAPLVWMSFFADGNFVQTITEDGLFQTWDWRKGEEILPALESGIPVTGVTVSQDGRHIAVFGNDFVRVWNLPRPDETSNYLLSQYRSCLPLAAENFEHSRQLELTTGSSKQSAETMRMESDDPLCDRELLAWHQRRLNEARLQRNQFAVEFHQQKMTKLSRQ